jgi:hypothetical protein
MIRVDGTRGGAGLLFLNKKRTARIITTPIKIAKNSKTTNAVLKRIKVLGSASITFVISQIANSSFHSLQKKSRPKVTGKILSANLQAPWKFQSPSSKAAELPV